VHAIVVAQVDSTEELRTIVVEENRIVQTIENGEFNNRSKLLSESLQTGANVDIRTTGVGVLAPVSFRGGNTTQTSVKWEGMSLESPTNAVMDLSLIPSYFIDRVEINSFSSGALGSGAISGSLSLQNSSKFKESTSIDASLNSLYNSFFGVDHRYRIRKVNVRTRLIAEYANNRFKYVKRDEKVFPDPSALRQGAGIMQEFWNSEGEWKWKNSIWFQRFSRDIPPTVLQVSRTGRVLPNQIDENLRIANSVKRSFKRTDLSLRTGYAWEKLRYKDPNSNLDNLYRNHMLNALAKINFRASKSMSATILIEDKYAHSKASVYYSDFRNEFSPSMHLKFVQNKFKLNGSIRQSYFLKNTSPFLPAMQLLWKGRQSTYSISASRNYRIPSMNDLFWNPGGNKYLNPEESFRNEMVWNYKSQNFNVSTELFYHIIVNQIRWLPTVKGYFEATQTSEKVWNRGMEFRLSYRDTFGRLTIQYKGSTQFIKSTLSESQPSLLDGYQQIYIPSIFVKNSISFQLIKSINLEMRSSWTSTRYLLSDHSESLPSFALFDIHVSHKWKHWSHGIEINNVLNQNYYILPYRALPGLSVKARVGYQILNKKATNL